MKIISWNLLRRRGASLHDIAHLVKREDPDILLMQEATSNIEQLPELIDGCCVGTLLPGRVHGPATWSRRGFTATVHPLPAGAIVDRVCQLLDFGEFALANVHLSHGQFLNRLQLRRIAEALPPRAAILGDYNLIGPALLPGFRDVGPREPTHIAGDMVPLCLDRCLVRGFACREAHALAWGRSDHRPIAVHLDVETSERQIRSRRILRGWPASYERQSLPV